ncbi:hypothetical protein E1H18_1551 [Caulobacter sp. RHG1]|nr:hypothetical protein [Caulobacter sp. RHG1]
MSVRPSKPGPATDIRGMRLGIIPGFRWTAGSPRQRPS